MGNLHRQMGNLPAAESSFHARCVPNCVPIKKFLQMIKLEKVGGDLIKGHLALYKNGTCWLVYNNRTHKVVEPCMNDEKKAIELIDKLLEEEKIKENNNQKINKKNIINKEKMKWIDYWKQACKGKKFGSRAEVNSFMKEQAKIWREKYKK
jgi:hypothetical protein